MRRRPSGWGPCAPQWLRARESPFSFRVFDDGPDVAVDGRGELVESCDDRARTARADEAQGGLDLRAHGARREVAGGGIRLHLGERDPADVVGVGRAPAGDGVRDVGRDDERVGVDGAGEQGGREVLVDNRLDAVHGAVTAADDGDATTAGRDDDVTSGEERVERMRLEDLDGLGGGDDATPALLAAVLPALAVVDERLGLLAGQEAPDRLRRVGEAGSSASTRVRVMIAATGRSTWRAARAPSRVSSSVKPIVPCVWAPHQSSGTGGTTCAASSFLTRRLPTWGPLPCVMTTSWPAATSSARWWLATAMASSWAWGVALPSGPVMALPPSATSTLTARPRSSWREPRERGGAGALSPPAQGGPAHWQMYAVGRGRSAADPGGRLPRPRTWAVVAHGVRRDNVGRCRPVRLARAERWRHVG